MWLGFLQRFHVFEALVGVGVEVDKAALEDAVEAVHDKDPGDELLHTEATALLVLAHVLADNVADGGAFVVLEQRTLCARVLRCLLHLLLLQAGLLFTMIRHVSQEDFPLCGHLAYCAVIHQVLCQKGPTEVNFMDGLHMFHYIQLVCKCNIALATRMHDPDVKQVHMNSSSA